MIYNLIAKHSFVFAALLGGALSVALPRSSSAQNPKVFPVVDKMYANKEIKKPTTVEEWSYSEKSIPKGFKKLRNKTFSVVYPSCFELETEGDEEDEGVTGSPSVTFIASDRCDQKLKAENVKNISIGLSFSGQLTNLEDAFVAGKILLKKNIKINDVPAIYLSSVLDSCTDDGCIPELRNHVVLICNKKTYRVRSVVPPGKISKDLIDIDNYDLPETYKTMVSSFRCTSSK